MITFDGLIRIPLPAESGKDYELEVVLTDTGAAHATPDALKTLQGILGKRMSSQASKALKDAGHRGIVLRGYVAKGEDVVFESWKLAEAVRDALGIQVDIASCPSVCAIGAVSLAA